MVNLIQTKQVNDRQSEENARYQGVISETA